MRVASRRTLLHASAAVLLAPGLTLRADAQATAFTMHCGTAANDSAGPTFYAEALGYYKDTGLDVTLDFMNSTTSALASGATAIAAMPTTLASIAR